MREGWNKQELYPTNETVLPDEPFILIKFKSLVLFFFIIIRRKKVLKHTRKKIKISYITHKNVYGSKCHVQI